MGKLLARLLRITSFFQYFISKIEINKWSRFEKVFTPALEASALRFSGLMTEEVRSRKEFIAWQRHVTWQWERLWTLKWRKTSANSIKHRFRDIFCLLISNYRGGISDGKSKRWFFSFFFFFLKKDLYNRHRKACQCQFWYRQGFIWSILWSSVLL